MTPQPNDPHTAPGGAHHRVLDAFAGVFVREPSILVRAPGRVNLIGEHTDYTGGLVLPFAIDRALYFAAAPRDDGRVRGFGCDLGPVGESVDFEVETGKSLEGFASYLAAVAQASREAGAKVGGMDIAVASDIPIGSGLSSSAALCVAAALAIDAIGKGAAPREEIARRAHRAESHFVGTGCGILDPFAIALCEAGAALRIDCATQQTRSVSLPTSELAFVISHSGVSRELAGEEAGRGYRTRVEECARALEAMRAAMPDDPPESFRSIGQGDVAVNAAKLDPVLARRLRHVVSENARVDQVYALLGAEGPVDLAALGEVIRASHASLRDDYEVSIPELDCLCETADALSGVLGSRMVGAGFGGCALHLVEASAADRIGDALRADIRERTGREPEVFSVRADEGAHVEVLD